MMRFWAPLLSLVFVANSALACSVCGASLNEENQIAYLATTAFLTFLPLMFAGGLMWWVRKRAQEASGEGSSQAVQVLSLDTKSRSDV